MYDSILGAGLGLDLEDPRRLAAKLERRPTLAAKIFTAGELAYAGAQMEPALHLAARFCAKEAVIKALGLEAFEGHDIEILDGGADARVALHGTAARIAQERGVRVLVSMSHSPEQAGAVAWAVPIRDVNVSRYGDAPE